MTSYEIAQREVGVHETPGPKATQRIVEYHATTSLKATSDEIPWCSSFVNWCMAQAGVKGTGSAAAASWLKWGKPVFPAPGCVVVIRQKSAGGDKATGSTSGYHVGFYESSAHNYITILGGNQHDSVKSSAFPLAQYDVAGYRAPADDAA